MRVNRNKLPQKIEETIKYIKKNKIKVPPKIQEAIEIIETIKEYEENLNNDKVNTIH